MFCRRVESGMQTVRVFEDPEQQRRALGEIDFPTVVKYATEQLQKLVVVKIKAANTSNGTSNI